MEKEKDDSVRDKQNTIHALTQENQELKEALEQSKGDYTAEHDRRLLLEHGMARARERVESFPELENEASKLKTELKGAQDEKAKLAQDNEKKGTEIAWLKEQIQKREQEHKMAMNHREAQHLARISQLPPITPNKQRSTSRSGATPTSTTATPSTRTLQSNSHARTSRHANVSDTPSNPGRTQSRITELTPEMIREHALIAPRAQQKSVTPSRGEERKQGHSSSTPPPVARQLFRPEGANMPSKQSGMPPTIANPQMPPVPSGATVHPLMKGLDAQQQKSFRSWVENIVMKFANSRLASGNASETDLELFHSNAGARGYALHKATKELISTQGIQLRNGWQEEAQQAQSMQGKKASQGLSHLDNQPGVQFRASTGAGQSSHSVPGISGLQDAASFAAPNEEHLSPRRSPRLRALQTANASRNINNGSQQPNPIYQPQANMFQANTMAIQAPKPQNFNMQAAPQKSFPNMGFHPAPENARLFQGQIPSLSQPEQSHQPGPDDGSDALANLLNIDMNTFQFNDAPRLHGSTSNPILGSNDSGQAPVDLADLFQMPFNPFMNSLNNPIDTGNSGNDQSNMFMTPKLSDGLNAQFWSNSVGDMSDGAFGSQTFPQLPQIGTKNTQQAHTNTSGAQTYPTIDQASNAFLYQPAFPLPQAPSEVPPRATKAGANTIRSNKEQPKDIPDGGYRGTVCIECFGQWWNTWCDDDPQGCYNCKKTGKCCRRARCDNFSSECNDPSCKWAHASDGFSDTFIRPKGGLKRKNKKGDDHEEPPKKKQAGLMYPGGL